MTVNKLWENIFSTRPWGKYPPEDLVRYVANEFSDYNDRKTIKVLEIGSGTGSNVWFLAREGFSVYAIDGSDTGIKLTYERIKNDLNINEQNVNLLVGDIISLPYKNDFFDLVIDIEAISTNNLKDSIAILKSVHRVLKKGGKFYSKHFAEGSEGDGVGERIERNMYITSIGVLKGFGPVRYCSKEDILRLYGNIFKIENIEKNIRTVDNQKSEIIEWSISLIK